jgi:hypothetical protein
MTAQPTSPGNGSVNGSPVLCCVNVSVLARQANHPSSNRRRSPTLTPSLTVSNTIA